MNLTLSHSLFIFLSVCSTPAWCWSAGALGSLAASRLQDRAILAASDLVGAWGCAGAQQGLLSTSALLLTALDTLVLGWSIFSPVHTNEPQETCQPPWKPHSATAALPAGEMSTCWSLGSAVHWYIPKSPLILARYGQEQLAWVC